MNIRITLTLITLLHSVLLTHSQNLDFSLKWGKEFEERKPLTDIVGYDESGFYALKTQVGGFGGVSYTLDQFDSNFNLVKSLELEIEEEGKACQVQKLLQAKDNLFVLYSYQNKKEKKKILYIDEIDRSSLQLKGEKRKLGEIDYSGNSNRNSGNFSFKVSRDKTKILILYSSPDTKGDPELYGFNVLDENLNSIWEKTVTTPYAGGLFDIESVRVDNDGNVYLLGLVYKEKRRSKRNGQANYTYEAFAYTDQGNTMKQYTISLDDRFITDMQIEILNNNLICAGFYSEKGTFSIRGTYFLTIDAVSKEIKTKSFSDFGIDFIAQNMTEREAKITKKQEEKGKDPELFEYDLDKLLIGKDGSAMLIGEQYFVRKVTTYTYINNKRTAHNHYHYYYNDILAVKINPSGQIEWSKKIAKTQHSVDDGGYYASYTLAIINGQTCFIFNDNAENLDFDGEGRPANFNTRKSLAVVVSLDVDGKPTKQPIFNKADVDVIIRPKLCTQISNHDIILFSQRRKTQQFAKLTFN